MSIRMTGMASGLDVDNIVKELMKAQRVKSTKLQQKITTLEWTDDKWNGLNSKVYSFYTGSLSKIRMQGNFNTKKAESSNSAKADISATSAAADGVHTLKVKQLASAQFVTGSKLETDKNGKAVTLNTKLTDLNFSGEEGTTVTIKSGDKTVNMDIGSSTTVQDFLTALTDAGLNASYDTNQKRFFISSKASGVDNSFTITTANSEYARDRNNIREFLEFDSLAAATKSNIDNALMTYVDPASLQSDKDEAKASVLAVKQGQVQTKFINDYMKDQNNIDRVTNEVREEMTKDLSNGEELDADKLRQAIDTRLYEEGTAAAKVQYDEWKEGNASADSVFKIAETQLDALFTEYETDSGTAVTTTNDLSFLKLSEIKQTNPDDASTITVGSGVALVKASDAVIIYNGAELKGSSNVFKMNNITVTVKGITAGADTEDPVDDEVITLGVSADTQAVYDTIKGFIKDYNELLKEMNSNYYADSARGYDPLTDEQKEAMTDDQIKQWESKIKDSLLRRDSNLESILSAVRTSFSKSVEVNGKSYSLSSFGIGSTDYTEKGQLHIDGDVDDSAVAVKTDKLMKALSEDPDTVAKVFSKLASDLYSDLSDRMKSNNLRSALTVYNDKELKKNITNYKDDLSDMETKLTEMETRYYNQFSAMETALAKLNSQSSSILSMLGSNSSQ